MNNDIFIDLGRTYQTNDGIMVTPIKHLSNTRALFVTDEFYPTPFVSWEYHIGKDNMITLYRGNYYSTLDKALRAENNDPGMMRLELSFYCPDCDTIFKHEIELSSNVQSIVEQIEDFRVRCPECNYMFLGISEMVLKDNNTRYEMPLWHGPVTTEYLEVM